MALPQPTTQARHLHFGDPAQLPGPKVYPLIGSALGLGSPRRFIDWLHACHDTYGDPFSVRLQGRWYVVTADPEVCQLAMLHRPNGGSRGPMGKQTFHKADLLGSVFVAEGEEWSRRRAMLVRALGAQSLSAAEQMVWDVVDSRLRNDMEPAVAGEAIEITARAKRFSGEVIQSLTFGDSRELLSAHRDAIYEDAETLMAGIGRLIATPLPGVHLLPTRSNRQFWAARRRLIALSRQLVAEARARIQREGESFVARTLVEAMCLRQAGEDAFTDEEIEREAIEVLVAGQDTTSTTLAGALFLLAQNPRWQERIAEEVREGERQAGGRIPLSGIGQFPLLEGAIYEALRIYTPAPFFFSDGREPFEVRGETIGAEHPLILLAHKAALSAMAHPGGGFDPARYADKAELAKAVKAMPMPFGGGPRMCPGRNLSLVELKAYLSEALKRYRFEGPGPDEAIRFDFGLVAMPRPFGLRVRRA